MNPRTALENRPDVLRRIADTLWERLERGEQLTGGQHEALVEASFRLGVHRRTEPATALELLARAHRLDPANPKHPYHAGLLYLRHGHTEPAVRWLTAAAELAPVNHRVWAHLALAYRQLDERQQGAADRTGEHRARAEAIADTIRAGRDDFGPEGERTALPLLRPGECRWSGIHDMAADGRLRGRTAERTRDALLDELERVAGLAPHRRGGTAAFTVLAVQWMVYGYPAATVRRLAGRLPSDEDDPALRMLHLVCDLFETDRARLPARLARCLAERTLPDVLVALIHRQRLLWRPLGFPDPGAHAAAREFTDGDPVRHEKALRAARRTLSAPEPEPMPDAVPGPAAPPVTDPDARLTAFESAASGLAALRADVHTHVRELARDTVADAADHARVSGDAAILAEVIDRLQTLRTAWLQDLQRFKEDEPAGLAMPFDEFQRRLENCEGEYQEPLGSTRSILKKRVERKLAGSGQRYGPAPGAPSPRARSLEKRLTVLEAHRRTSDGHGRPSDAVPAALPDERLAALEEAAAVLTDVLDDAVRHAKAVAKDTAAGVTDLARLLGDHTALTGLADDWETVRLSRLAELGRFADAEPAGLVMAFEEYQRRLGECQALLQRSAGSLRKILDRKVRPRLEDRRHESSATAPAPSPQALALTARLAALTAPAAPSAVPPRAGPGAEPPAEPEVSRAPHTDSGPLPATASARERVDHALAAAEAALDANFTEARQTLDAYPAELKRREAVVLLRTYLDGRQAEADLRLGRGTAARRRWNAMLTDDPLHPAVLHNLAVAHTSAGDTGTAAQAWNRYLEALYLRDLLHGDIRRGAAERARIHRVLAASFGTLPLCRGLVPGDERDDDPRPLITTLASRGKVATATAHLRLEELNHLLTYRGPGLLLGLGRSAGGTAADAALARRTTLVEHAVAALPERVREPFAKLCQDLFDGAHRAAAEAKGRTRRPGDEAEEETHTQWVRERILWKAALFGAVMAEDADWPLAEYSGDVIGNLRLVDALPLDPEDELLLRTVQQLGARGSAKAFAERYNRLAEHAADRALGHILDAAGAAASTTGGRDFPDRFRRVGRSWGRNPVPSPYAEALDDPVVLYQDTVRSAVRVLEASGTPRDDRERAVVTAAVPGLERWVARLPGATGPARVLARLLGTLGRHDEEAKVLNRAEREAAGPHGRRQIARSYVRLRIGRGEYAEAVQQARTLLRPAPDDEQLRGLLTEAYDRWLRSDPSATASPGPASGTDLPSPEEIAEDFARWTDPTSVHNRRQLVVAATRARHEARADGAGAGPLVTDMRALYTADPGNTEALFHLTHSLCLLAWEVRKEMVGATGTRRRELRDRLKEIRTDCVGHAEELLPLTDGERHTEVRRILDEVRPAPT
ncbi:hypothetical protein GCM10010358_63590 [Streptomyces minutiscleroticus]|uniref:Tetratricopeptide repeat protein n=1 Tax=Streptomyces minutiscleroticus TaxID=68238 RepID=A0A918U6R5_9ACTN|nr:hypothetical protein [Streptomyces minutiscleroticus]GGY00923.1 hypothetical protein GCM10010358_63590 [Streptomyces minutiscleroticus]